MSGKQIVDDVEEARKRSSPSPASPTSTEADSATSLSLTQTLNHQIKSQIHDNPPFSCDLPGISLTNNDPSKDVSPKCCAAISYLASQDVHFRLLKKLGPFVGTERF